MLFRIVAQRQVTMESSSPCILKGSPSTGASAAVSHHVHRRFRSFRSISQCSTETLHSYRAPDRDNAQSAGRCSSQPVQFRDRCRPTHSSADVRPHSGSRAQHGPGHHDQQHPELLSRRTALALVAAAAELLSLRDRAEAKPQGGDWTSPGLAAVEDDAAPKFTKLASGVKIQELRVGSGPTAQRGDRVEIEYVLRRANGYFIYSTVEGVSFQPRDVPIGPIDLTLGDGRTISGLEEVIIGMQPSGKRRALIPPEAGYLDDDALLPQPPGFAARRQLVNHKAEPLIFEVQLVRIRG